MSSNKIATSLFVAAISLFVFQREALAVTYTHTVCIKVRAGHLDAATGDYGTATTWIGRGIKFMAFGTKYNASESSGCKTFTSSSGGGLTQMVVYAESKIGGSGNITVRSFPTEAAMDTWNGNQVDGNLSQWVLQVVPSCTGTTCTTNITNTANEADVVSNLHAAGVWSIFHVDNATSPRLSGAKTVFLHNSGCGANNVSCQDGNVLRIQSASSGARRKFLIGHEAGHWLHQQWVGGSILQGMGNPYEVENPPGSTCDSTGVPGEHGLRSLEFEGGAFVEGFAHFMSTLAYNDHDESNAAFHYYKSVAGLYDYDIVDVEHGPDGGDDNHYANGCGCPAGCSYNDSGAGAVVANELGTELDWLRAYWDFRTNGPEANRPTHRDIFDHLNATYDAEGGFGLTDTHDRLVANLPGEFASEWDSAMDFNGADNTPE